MIDNGLDFAGLKYYTEKFKQYIENLLSAVAKSGSYNDLKNKPTIPSVGNGQLTIKQNGTTKGTFAANQTNNVTIELTDESTTYVHPTSSGNKHIPSGGSSGQILRWSADGTAVWGNDNNTTYGVVSTTANGLAPKRDGSTTKFLRGDGTWAVPPDTNTTYSNFVKSGSGAKAGLVPAPPTTAGTTKYLREDGSWQTPAGASQDAFTATEPTNQSNGDYWCKDY